MFYDHAVVLVCLAMLVPVSIISYFYGKRMKRLNQLKNDELEKQVEIIGSRNTKKIAQHYNNLRKWQVKISDKEAWNFGIMELLVLAVIIASLLITTGKNWHEGFLAGDIVAIYNYILKFVSGVDTIPYAVQRLSALKDITRRIEFDEAEI
jgi:ABC-type multidrug transport system fused ATPase/permease subunit